jgi:hypothetical protein
MPTLVVVSTDQFSIHTCGDRQRRCSINQRLCAFLRRCSTMTTWGHEGKLLDLAVRLPFTWRRVHAWPRTTWFFALVWLHEERWLGRQAPVLRWQVHDRGLPAKRLQLTGATTSTVANERHHGHWRRSCSSTREEVCAEGRVAAAPGSRGTSDAPPAVGLGGVQLLLQAPAWLGLATAFREWLRSWPAAGAGIWCSRFGLGVFINSTADGSSIEYRWNSTSPPLTTQELIYIVLRTTGSLPTVHQCSPVFSVVDSGG